MKTLTEALGILVAAAADRGPSGKAQFMRMCCAGVGESAFVKERVQGFWRGLLASSFLAAAVLPLRSDAANLLVYNTHDSGAGSLRQAIENNRLLGGGNTIIFSNVVTGTITLTTGELLISNNVTILGPGANVLAVSGNAASRVFLFTNYYLFAGVTAFISGLTITNGSASGYGGGIYSFPRAGGNPTGGTLTLSNCTIAGNTATSRGGGIYNDEASLTVVGSTLSGNSAPSGGGIFNDTTGFDTSHVTVIGSTLSSNTATYGGGIYNYGVVAPCKLTVLASTLSGNSAATNGLGGGIYNVGLYGPLEIGDTILKAGAYGANITTNLGGKVMSDGYNLSDDNGGGFLTAFGDQINTDPMLGPLRDNGGPTPTIMPLPGSPAIDQGKRFGVTTDQRGRCRTYDDPNIPNAPGGDGTDIGAVEVSPAHTTVVGTTNDNGVSLRWCACEAQPGNTITFAPGVTGTMTLTAGELLISNKNLTILGPGANVLGISGGFNSRVFHVANSVASISGLGVVNGAVGSGTIGGGIYNDHSTLTLSNCAVNFNSAGEGGGIYSDGEGGTATLTIVASTVNGNNATKLGGGIFNDANHTGVAKLTLVASTVSSNFVSSGGGGGIYNDGEGGFAALMVTNCTLAGNSSLGGGGIYNDGSSGGPATLTLIASTLSGNYDVLYLGDNIYNGGASGAAFVEIGNTILDYNSSYPNIVNNSGTVTSLGYNLSGANDSAVLNAATDQNSTAPMLGPLQNNGGPTLTMAPLPGSQAIDQGNSFGLTTDQRGRPRPYDNPAIPNPIGGDGSDIGAVEIQSAESPSILVTTINDSGAGSLRQALSIALPGSSVLFGSNVTGTITLTSGELVSGKSVNILGPGANLLAVSGNSATRVFHVTNGYANISQLTLRDGTVLGFTGRPGQTVGGGGIYCEAAATVELSDSVISNCAAIGGHGANSFVLGNGGNGGTGLGGGILNDGKLTLDRCVVANNQALGGAGGNGTAATSKGGNGGAGIGGGIYSELGSVILNACTLSGNRATFGSGGGGGTAGGNGFAWAGGLNVGSGTATLIDCTIASNIVNGAGTGLGGGIYSGSSAAVLFSCTVAGNSADSSGGGIYSTSAGVTNTIIADNTAASGPDVSGAVTSGGYNLIGNTNGSSGFGTTGDLLNVNPLLGALQDNGGPTPTMALLAGSPAIDHGKSFGLTTDQRGFSRIDPPDIGAFEFGAQPPPVIIALSGNLAFGNVTNGTTAQSTLTISNAGNTTMTVSNISYPNGFSGAWQGTVPSGGSQQVLVTFAPTAAVMYGGNLTVNADQTSGNNVYPISGTGIPARAVVTLNPATLNQVYDGTPKLVTVTTTPPGLAVNITYSGSTNPPTGVGSYAIVATVSGPVYAGAASGTLTVTPAPLTVTAKNASRTYGIANPTFTADISGFVNGETAAVVSGAASLSTTATAGSAVGSYPITPSLGSLSAANYTFANFVNGTLTVGPAPLTVTANNASRTYGSPNPSFTANISGFVNGDTVAVVSGAASLSTTATAASAVGSYPITPSLGSLSAANYTFANFVNGTLTVGPAPLTVTANNASRPYGAANPSFSASYSGFVNGDTTTALQGSPSFSTSATPSSPPGSYPIIVAKGTLSAQNYNFTFINGTLTITTTVFNFLQIALGTNGGVVLSMQGIAGSSYQVRVSNDLVTWTLLTTVTADAAGALQVQIPISTSSGDARFYRVLGQ